MLPTTQTQQTPSLDASTALLSNQLVLRSNAISLIEHSADEAEIVAAITPQLRDHLPLALRYSQLILRPCDDPEMLLGLIGSFVGLVGQDWSPIGRQEFIFQAARQLEKVPGDLLAEAIALARDTIFEGRRLVPFVNQQVGQKAARRRLDCDNLRRLVDLAAGKGSK